MKENTGEALRPVTRMRPRKIAAEPNGAANRMTAMASGPPRRSARAVSRSRAHHITRSSSAAGAAPPAATRSTAWEARISTAPTTRKRLRWR